MIIIFYVIYYYYYYVCQQSSIWTYGHMMPMMVDFLNSLRWAKSNEHFIRFCTDAENTDEFLFLLIFFSFLLYSFIYYQYKIQMQIFYVWNWICGQRVLIFWTLVFHYWNNYNCKLNKFQAWIYIIFIYITMFICAFLLFIPRCHQCWQSINTWKLVTQSQQWVIIFLQIFINII